MEASVEAVSVDEALVASVVVELTNEVNDEVAVTCSLDDEDVDSTEVALETLSVES